MSERAIFLPGVGGSGRFWAPVADRIVYPADKVLVDWPGLGNSKVPLDPNVRGYEDLVGIVLQHFDRPVDLIAQSMGGVIAVMAALKRPDMVRHLVLNATSGGIDMQSFSRQNWRTVYRDDFPSVPEWVTEERPDLTDRIGLISAPTLLIWGDADPISPLAVGRRLATLLPNGELVVVKGGTHSVARDHADEVAQHIARHLGPGEGTR